MSRKFFRTRAASLCAPVLHPAAHVLLVLLVVTGMGIAHSAEFSSPQSPALSEREAIAAALTRPAWVEAETGRSAVAESMVSEAALWPNPELSFNRDRVHMPDGDIAERSVQITQTFDISGRRGLRRAAANQRLDAARLDGRTRRLDAVGEVRRAFAATQHRTELQAMLGLWLTRIEEGARVTTRLAAAGEVSGYDRRRLEREAQTAKARLSVAQADAARSRELLAALTGKKIDEVVRLQGELLPDATPALEGMQAGLSQRPDLVSLLVQAEAHDHERRAAQRGWVPELTLGIGQKTLEDTGRSGSGNTALVAFSLPFFDRSQAAQQRGFVQAQTLRAEHALALAQAEAELRGAWQQAEELRKAALAYRSDASNDPHRLSAIAEAAYRAGEAGLLELLDAYRAERDAYITELDLALRARLVRIELETLSGVTLHE